MIGQNLEEWFNTYTQELEGKPQVKRRCTLGEYIELSSVVGG